MTPLPKAVHVKVSLILTSVLITIAATLHTTPVHWAIIVNKAAQEDDWRGRLTWLAAATNMPSGVLSPPTLGLLFAPALLPSVLFTRQTLFTQRWLAVCLQHISHISWLPPTSDSATMCFSRAFWTGPRPPVAPVRRGQKVMKLKHITSDNNKKAVKETCKHGSVVLEMLQHNILHHRPKTNKLAQKGLLSNKGSWLSRFLKSISLTDRTDLNENRLWWWAMMLPWQQAGWACSLDLVSSGVQQAAPRRFGFLTS